MNTYKYRVLFLLPWVQRHHSPPFHQEVLEAPVDKQNFHSTTLPAALQICKTILIYYVPFLSAVSGLSVLTERWRHKSSALMHVK